MKIIFELFYIQNNESSGVALYAFNLINNYNRFHPEDSLSILCWDHSYDSIKKWLDNNNVTFEVINPHELYKHNNEGWIKRKLWRYELYKLLKQYDLCISPFANNSPYGMSPFIRHIGVVHDLQIQKLDSKGKNFTERFRIRALTTIHLLCFSQIVVISNCVKKELISYALIHSTVIYNTFGYLSESIEKPPISINEKDDYILDVNNFYEYKNAGVLIDAFYLIKDEFPNLKLFLKGTKFDYYNIVVNKINEYGIQNRVIVDTSKLTSQQISWLFHNARLYVSPSLMEGFGETPIEAAVVGIPVIVSDIGTHKEVLGECATYFNPFSAKDLATKIRFVICNPPSRNILQYYSNSLKNKYSTETQISSYYKIIHK